MSLFVVGVQERNNIRLYRIFNSNTNICTDLTINNIINYRLRLANAELKDNELVGTTGSLEKIINKESFIILGMYEDSGKEYYRVAHTSGKVAELEKSKAIEFLEDKEVQNATIVSKSYIRGINWEIPTIKSEKSKELFSKILKIVMYHKANCHKEMPMIITPDTEHNKIGIKCRTVQLYESNYNCTEINSIISIEPNKMTIDLYDIIEGKKNKNGSITIPYSSNEELINKFETESDILLGLCGYVRGDVAKSFMSFRVLSKADFDAIDAYTNGSGHINRTCRNMAYDNEKSGDNLSATLREIHYLDDLLSNNQVVAPITLFRGCPYDDYIKKVLGKPADKLEGCILKDDAYFSTTINFQVTPNFATGRFKDRPDVPGIIQVYKNNLGIYGRYIHDVAKWDEQYEILVDRRYDTVIKEKLFALKLHGKTFYVYNCKFEMHRDRSKYNIIGKVPFDDKYSEGVLHQVYDNLRRRGYNYLSYYDGKDKTKDIPNMIIVPNKERTEETEFKDLGIGYKVNNLGIVELTLYNLTGKRDRVYIYREDRAKGTIDTTTLLGYNVDELNSISYRSTLRVTNSEPETITNEIVKYLRFSGEAILFSLIDLGRFFNEMFTSVLYKEGYDIFETFRVERCGDTSKSQTGYVPLKFRINGDDDDSLLLNMKLYKNSSKNCLVIEYSGQSLNKKVKSRNVLSFSSFNTEVAERVAKKILYEFATKLNLSCVRKMDNAASEIAHRTNHEVVRLFNTKSPRDVAYTLYKNNHKDYRISVYKPFTDTYNCDVGSENDITSFKSRRFLPGSKVNDIAKEVIQLMKQLNKYSVDSNLTYTGIIQEIISYATCSKLDYKVIKDVNSIDDIGALRIRYTNKDLIILTKFEETKDNKFVLNLAYKINNEEKINKVYSLEESNYKSIADSIVKDINKKLGLTPYRNFTARMLKLDKIMNLYFSKISSDTVVTDYSYSLDNWTKAYMKVNNHDIEVLIKNESMVIDIVDSSIGIKQSIPFTQQGIYNADDLIKRVTYCISALSKKHSEVSNEEDIRI